MIFSALFLTVFFSGSYLLYRERKTLQHEDRRREASIREQIATPIYQPRRQMTQTFGDNYFPDPRSVRNHITWQQRPFTRLQTPTNLNQPHMATTWKRAVNNLLLDATIRIGDAQRLLQSGDVVEAVLFASLSVEKIARALLHCYGIKPNTSYGQAEGLRLLHAVVKESLDEDFQKSIETVEEITAAKTSLDLMRSNNATQTRFIDQTTAKHICHEATKTATLYKKIIDEKFAKELEF